MAPFVVLVSTLFNRLNAWSVRSLDWVGPRAATAGLVSWKRVDHLDGERWRGAGELLHETKGALAAGLGQGRLVGGGQHGCLVAVVLCELHLVLPILRLLLSQLFGKCDRFFVKALSLSGLPRTTDGNRVVIIDPGQILCGVGIVAGIGAGSGLRGQRLEQRDGLLEVGLHAGAVAGAIADDAAVVVSAGKLLLVERVGGLLLVQLFLQGDGLGVLVFRIGCLFER